MHWGIDPGKEKLWSSHIEGGSRQASDVEISADCNCAALPVSPPDFALLPVSPPGFALRCPFLLLTAFRALLLPHFAQQPTCPPLVIEAGGKSYTRGRFQEGLQHYWRKETQIKQKKSRNKDDFFQRCNILLLCALNCKSLKILNSNIPALPSLSFECGRQAFF